MRPEILNPLFVPVSELEGIGPKLTRSLTRLIRGSENAETARIADLLFHLPYTVIDRRRQPDIANAVEGVVQTFRVTVGRHNPPPRGNRRVPYRIEVHDDTGDMTLVFFRGHSEWLSKTLPEGDTRFISGKVELFNGRINMVHPDLIATEAEFGSLPLLEPVYPATAGLSGKVLAKSVRTALASVPKFPEWTDKSLIERERWPSFHEAIHRVHHPKESEDVDPNSPSRRRLAHDELLAGQLALALLRMKMRKTSGISRAGDGHLSNAAIQELPYSLTGAQLRSLAEINGDLAKKERMLRLLQGDVGSGKTIVALLACLNVIETGAQTAIMAPTEILARQHYATIKPLCETIGVRVGLLIGKSRAAERREVVEKLEAGEIDLVVGTHALFQGGVSFRSLGLAVIDEQHRFGVHQRLTLGDKGMATDILVMTATPIPRTLVLTAYGDMDVSKLDEKPKGRQPIQTNAVSADRIGQVVERISAALESGSKVYWICPLVEESEEIKATAAEDRFKDLQSRFGTLVGLVHGRMDGVEKAKAMDDFKESRTKILVATTVIEVGVDVPDATIMIIEHAERFGLAQLHQLRGRVGRGSDASHCLLLYYTPLSENAEARLRIMRETEDGFRIAEEDLKLRGEGEILGTRQSGTPGFNLARMEFHSEILEFARTGARLILERNPELEGEQGEALRSLLYLFGQDQAVKLLRAG